MKNVFPSFKSATFEKINKDRIKKLVGFSKKRRHTVPKVKNKHTEGFVETCGGDEIRKLADKIVEFMVERGVARASITKQIFDDTVKISSPDTTSPEIAFYLSLQQSSDADDYVLKTEAKLKDPALFAEGYIQDILNEFTEDLVLGFTGPNIDVSEKERQIIKVPELENAVRYEDDRKSFRVDVKSPDVSIVVSESCLKLRNIFSKPDYDAVNEKLNKMVAALTLLNENGVVFPVTYAACGE